MSGAPDPLYILARRVLLDGLDALDAHADALILVGAQAIYLHTGDTEMAVAPYTTDADLALHTLRLGPRPLIEELMLEGQFRHGDQPGIWVTTHDLVDVQLDLLVAESLGGGGRRGARLPEHGNTVARKVRGLEAALVDYAPHELKAFEPDDERRRQVLVAGPGALLVMKLHKLQERVATPERLKPKDAHDVLRLLRGVPIATFQTCLHKLQSDSLSTEVTQTALSALPQLFVGGVGSRLAAQASAGLEPAKVVEASCAALARELMEALEH